MFGNLDDGLYGHPDGLQAAADVSKATPPAAIIKHDALGYGPYCGDMTLTPGGQHAMGGHRGAPHQMTPLHAFGESMLDQLSAATVNMAAMEGGGGGGGGGVGGGGNGVCGIPSQQMYSSAVYAVHHRPVASGGHNHHHHHHHHPGHQGGGGGVVPGLHSFPPGAGGGGGGGGVHGALHPIHGIGGELGDCDTRELEAFAEHFKQRRIKIGVTQADVGSALGKLKIPGVGSLSQSTICRFESLTLSHNNMVALKPVLQAWLEEAERAARDTRSRGDLFAGAGGGDKKRKRTSIAAPEKRSLEAYFAIQPRPSGEKIAQIADKLDLKKNVVRVWFCNQRQKQKRMKVSATSLQGQLH